MNGRQWTDKEIEFLKENYPVKCRKYCSDSLNKTINSVVSKYQKIKNQL